MNSLRSKLLEARQRLKLPWEILERDYLLSWILAGIAQVNILRNGLIFKGGTALKKCYFGDYRFSEDLDFTAMETAPTGKAIEIAMQAACHQASKLLSEYAPVKIICERHQERNPHPRNQEAFDIRAQFPWHRQPQTNIMVEITVDEKLLRPASKCSIIHSYGEVLDAKLLVYSLEEIIAEKLRAILQNIQIFENKGWVRSRARDYYDLWRILSAYKDKLYLNSFSLLLQEKCQVRDVSFLDANSFFSDSLLQEVEKTWVQWLSPLLTQVPSYKQVIKELQHQVIMLLQY